MRCNLKNWNNTLQNYDQKHDARRYTDQEIEDSASAFVEMMINNGYIHPSQREAVYDAQIKRLSDIEQPFRDAEHQEELKKMYRAAYTPPAPAKE